MGVLDGKVVLITGTSKGGIGAPPPVMNRSSGSTGEPGRVRCSSMNER